MAKRGDGTNRATNLKFSDADRRMIAALRNHLGIQSGAEVVRLAIRELARAYCLVAEEYEYPPAPPPAPLRSHD